MSLIVLAHWLIVAYAGTVLFAISAESYDMVKGKPSLLLKTLRIFLGVCVSADVLLIVLLLCIPR